MFLSFLTINFLFIFSILIVVLCSTEKNSLEKILINLLNKRVVQCQ